jgi:hypothetical protein
MARRDQLLEVIFTASLVDGQDRGLGLHLDGAAIGACQLTGVHRQADGVDRLDQIGRRAVGDEGIEGAERKRDLKAMDAL